MGKIILVLTPHADDSELGMGGTIAKHVLDGDEVHILCIATHSNDTVRMIQMDKAAQVLGANLFYPERGQFRDGHIGEDMPALVGMIDHYKNGFKPDILYLPFPSVHQDHVSAYEAGLRSARISLSDSQWYIPTVLVYREPVSQVDIYSTGLQFSLFTDISGEPIKKKMEAISKHETEVLPYPHPSSPEYLDYEARAEGGLYGVEHAEVFAAVRKAL